MRKKKIFAYYYSTADSCQVSNMLCTVCGKLISDGDFRYGATLDAYLPQHRACCESDPEWKKIDSQRLEVEKLPETYEELVNFIKYAFEESEHCYWNESKSKKAYEKLLREIEK